MTLNETAFCIHQIALNQNHQVNIVIPQDFNLNQYIFRRVNLDGF